MLLLVQINAMKPINEQDTIVAVATPPGHGALGVVRLSGGESWDISCRLVRFPAGRRFRPQPWRAYFGRAVLEGGALKLDQVVALFYAAPKSYTGQQMAELTCHGSPAVLARLAEEAVALGARPADPGEFSLRAHGNGKLDLAQAEAVDALIRADSLGEALNAMAALEGTPSRIIAGIREELEEWLALLEAAIEFPEDLGPEQGTAAHGLDRLEGQLAEMGREFQRSRLLREGVRVTLTGRSNVGKSSVFNRLLRKKRAIVTSAPGTTRDLLEAQYHAGPVRVRLFDTAGLSTPRSEADRAGMRKSRQALARAEVLMVVVDASRPLTRRDRELCGGPRARDGLVLLNKVDLAAAGPHRERLQKLGAENVVEISARTGRGYRELERRLAARVDHIWGQTAGQGGGFMINLRQRKLLDTARRELGAVRRGLKNGEGEELVAHHLRRALETLDGFSGRTLPDRLLRRIFDRFCIGK
jgi:tRNA modification GTPase